MVNPLAWQTSPKKQKLRKAILRRRFVSSLAVMTLTVLLVNWPQNQKQRSHPDLTVGVYGTQPLMMKGGDPYIRALMRTISASE